MAFVCHICGKSFTTSEKLKYHRRCHGEEQIKCHICDEMFTGKRVFNKHIQSHQTFECSVCNETIKMNSRTSHSKKCAPIKEKSFNCSECPYVVDRQDRLKINIAHLPYRNLSVHFARLNWVQHLIWKHMKKIMLLILFNHFCKRVPGRQCKCVKYHLA